VALKQKNAFWYIQPSFLIEYDKMLFILCYLIFNNILGSLISANFDVIDGIRTKVQTEPVVKLL